MNILDHIVENRINEAIERGELSDLPGQGAPLTLDDDSMIPQELRMAYRILRNTGFVPPEVATLREIGDLERQIEELPQGGVRARALRKLQLLRARLEASGQFSHACNLASPYAGKLLDRLECGIGTDGADVAPNASNKGGCDR